MGSPVVVVSGLPRSGTSMMMRMLAAGGVPLLVDGQRAPDPDNPRGYFELEAVKATARDHSWVAEASGRCVKVISSLLPHLPEDRTYRVIFMRRALDQVVRSQRAMLERLERVPQDEDEQRARSALAEHLVEIDTWLQTARHMTVLGVSYERALVEPERQVRRVQQFLELDLDTAAMQRAIEPELQRRK